MFIFRIFFLGKSKGKKKKKKEIDSFAEAFAKEKEDIKDAKEKKKVDDLWAGSEFALICFRLW